MRFTIVAELCVAVSVRSNTGARQCIGLQHTGIIEGPLRLLLLYTYVVRVRTINT